SLNRVGVRRLKGLLVAAALILGRGALSFAAQEGSVTGRVTQGGNPAAGVVLVLTRLMPDSMQGLREALEGQPIVKFTTDEDGRYGFTGRAAGRYQVSPFSPSTVVTSGQGWVSLADGASVEGIDFDLSRGGVITGRVSTADGRPVIGEMISV